MSFPRAEGGSGPGHHAVSGPAGPDDGFRGKTEQRRCPTCGALHPRKRSGPFSPALTNLPESLVRTLAIWALEETVLDLEDMRVRIQDIETAA